MSNTQNVHCRLCAELKPPDQLVDLEAEKEKKIRVLERLSRLNLQVTSLHTTEDVLPKTVCSRCMESLFKAYNFVLDVETAQEALKVHLLVQNIKKNLDKSCLGDENKCGSQDVKVERVCALTGLTENDAKSSLNSGERLQINEDLRSNGLRLQNVSELCPNNLCLNIKLESNVNELQTDLEQSPVENHYESDPEIIDNKEFQVDPAVGATDELKNRLEEDLDTNDFKKDFEVTVAGYQMEISSKLSLNKSKINVATNENSITDENDLLIDLGTVDIDDSQIENISNVNNDKTSSLMKYGCTNIHRKRKFEDSEDLNDSRTELVRNSNVTTNALQCSKEDLTDNIIMSKPIVFLNEISIHNGNKQTLIISPLTINKSKIMFDSKMQQQKIDLSMSSDEKKSVNNIQKSTNEVKKPPKKKGLVQDKLLTQSEFSWKKYIWQCGGCKRNFDRINKLIKHSKEIHNCCSNYKCTDCTFRSSLLDIFVNHVTMHRGYLSQSCFKCHRSFESPHLIQIHYESYMKSGNLCKGCYEVFESKEKLAKHEQRYRKPKSISQASFTEFEKNVQTEKIVSLKEVQKNLQMENALSLKEVESYVQIEKTESLKEVEKNEQVEKTASLKEVEKNVQMEKAWFLKECEENVQMEKPVFLNEVEKNIQMEKATSLKEVQKNIETEKTAFLKDVERNVENELTGLDEKQYICDYCGKLFMYKHFLVYHIEMHHKL